MQVMTDEQLNAIMHKADDDLDRLKDRCHDLYEENQKLRKLCDKYEEEHITVFQEWLQDISMNKATIKDIEKYKTRCEKAIEYIEKAGLSNYEKELYNILIGSDDNGEVS